MTQLRTIMYVDDEPHIRELVEMALSLSAELTVHSCESGVRALAAMVQVQPDLVLLDVMMPEMDGPAVLKAMRADPRLASIPVAFMTARAMPGEVQELLDSGAVGVIPKPFDPMTLARQVASLWEVLPHGAA